MLPPPLRGKAAAAADTWGPGLGGAPSQSRERCPTRETHVMKPGEGGQVAPSLPGSGQTCLESQGRTRSSNPPTRSHLTQPAASLLLLSSPPHPPLRPSRPPPSELPPASPPAPLLIHLARTAQTAQGAHAASLCAEPEPEAAGTPCTPPTEQHLKAAAPGSSSGFQSSDSEEPLRRDTPHHPREASCRTVLTPTFRYCRQECTVAPARRAMERIPSAQPPPACLPKAPGLEPGDLPG